MTSASLSPFTQGLGTWWPRPGRRPLCQRHGEHLKAWAAEAGTSPVSDASLGRPVLAGTWPARSDLTAADSHRPGEATGRTV